MGHHYLLKNKFVIPNFLFIAVASWAIALVAVTTVGVIVWIIWGTMHFDLLKALPAPLSLLLGFCGAYAGIGAICLYVTMWIYWVGVERSSFFIRSGWLLALLFGLPYGALIYAYRVWRTDITKVTTAYPVAGTSQGS